MRSLDYPYLDHPGPLAIAHRGGSEAHPENTMAAVGHAADLGCRYVEIDVQVSRDAALCVVHDDSLKRLTGNPSRVRDLTWPELKSVRVMGREPIPLLDEVLDAWPELRFNIDAKSEAVVEPLAEAIRRTGAIDRVCVGGISDASLNNLRDRLGPRLCTALGPRGVMRLRLASMGLPAGGFVGGAAQVPPRYGGLPLVDRRFLRAAEERALNVQVWTINEEVEMNRLLDLGVDAIITDRPSLLKSVLDRRGLWNGG